MAKKQSFFQKPNKKVVVQLLSAVVAFVVAVLGLEVDPAQSAVVSNVIGFVAGYIVKE